MIFVLPNLFIGSCVLAFMVVEALFSGKTTGLIIEALASGRALTALEIHEYALKRRSVTYQAVHKQIVLLRKKCVVSQVEGTQKYLLNPEWLARMSEFWFSALKNYNLSVKSE